VDWINIVAVTHLSAYKKDLPLFVKSFQVFVSSVAHRCIYVLIIHIFVDASRE